MVAFGFLLFFLLIAVIYLAAIVMFLPIFIGIAITIIVNLAHKSGLGKFAPVWWHILTIFVTIFTFVLLNEDIFNEKIDLGALSFVILGIYAFASILWVGISAYVRQKRQKRKSYIVKVKKRKNNSLLK